MSAAFTSPADQTWQTLLDEITLAYSERRQAIGQSAYTPSDGKDVQAMTYWTVLQNWLENNYANFIDHANGPVNPAGTNFLYFTLATFRSAAEFNDSGFRRVPEGIEWNGVTDPVWSYGPMQAGDIIGPWIFEDLQKGFSVLSYTAKSGSFGGTGKSAALNGGDQTDEHRLSLAWMESAVETLYADQTAGGAGALSVWSRILHFDAGGGYVGYDAALCRSSGNLAVTGIPVISGITHTWEAFLVASEVVWPPYFASTHTSVFTTFGDFTYPPTEGVFSMVEQDTSPSSDSGHDFFVGSLVAPPWPSEPALSESIIKGYSAGGVSFLIEWSFTNA